MESTSTVKTVQCHHAVEAVKGCRLHGKKSLRLGENCYVGPFKSH